MSIRQRIKVDLLHAMKIREKTAVATLRTMLAALDNAEAVTPDDSFQPVLFGQNNDVPRKVLSEEEFLQVLQHEANKCRAALTTYEGLGRAEEADRLRAELAVLARYIGDLPA